MPEPSSLFLNRWLSIHRPPKLERSRGIIDTKDSILFGPTYQIFDGKHSTIIYQQNFVSQRPFTLILDQDTLNSLQNELFIWCIKATFFDPASIVKRTVKRYKLTTSTEIIYAPMYNGETIPIEFCLEAWSTSKLDSSWTGANISSNRVTLRTSLVGDFDNRTEIIFDISPLYFNFKGADFQNNNPNSPSLFNLPLTFNINLNGTFGTNI